MFAVGLMSGTSLDGVDALLCEITGSQKETKVNVLGFQTIPYSDFIRNEIKTVCSEQLSSVDLICSLNFKLGKLFSEAVRVVCDQVGFDSHSLDFIASHGQTIYHIPHNTSKLSASTLQIGEPAIIAYDHHTQVISNFRVMDMAAGGEGAPLVPYSEYILYGSEKKSIALQNIGGISNVTFLEKNGSLNDVFAFDNGVGNMMIDESCQILFNKTFDDDGKIAANGNILFNLLAECMQHPYLAKLPPKSTGREEFGSQYTHDLLERYRSELPEDIVATFTYFTAKCIAKSYEDFIMKKYEIDQVLLGGGGAHNATLIKHLKELLPSIEILTQDEIGYSSDAKEALAFVIMGNETLHGNFSNAKNATGAKRSVILGNITPNPYPND